MDRKARANIENVCKQRQCRSVELKKRNELSAEKMCDLQLACQKASQGNFFMFRLLAN